MGGAPLHHVRVVNRDHVPVLELLDVVWRVLQHSIYGAPELAHHHPALAVGNERELVGLLTDDGAYGRSDQHPVHLVADVTEGVLDDVEGDLVYVVLADEVRRFFVDGHSIPPRSGCCRSYLPSP